MCPSMRKIDSTPNPFTHGKVVNGEQFTNRLREMDRITNALRGNNNLLIAGDRRIGKTSLIRMVLGRLSNEGHECFYFNMDPITSTKAFIEKYAALFTGHRSFGKKAAGIVGMLVKSLRFETTFSDDGTPSFNLKWGSPALPSHSDVSEVLKLPDKLASKSKKPLILVFDEFQTILQFKDEIDIIAEIRSAALGQKNINYVFMGSETSMLERMFSSSDEKFFNSVRKEPVGLIAREEFVKFIISRFAKRGVQINSETADSICKWARDIPADIQHFCAVIWDSLPVSASSFGEKDFPAFLAGEIEYQDERFLQLWKALSGESDRMILRELAFRRHSQMTSEFCHSVGMDKSTISRRLKKLTHGQLGFILHKRRDGYYFSDPFFEEWVRQKA